MKYLSGVLITAVMAAIAFALAELQFCKDYQLSPLVICIVMGMILGNCFQKQIPNSCNTGIKFSQQKLLRLGIILYGFFITFQQIIAVGLTGLVVALLIIATTFIGGTWLGVKVFGLDKKTSMLTAAGSAICGAAAILAAEPIVKAKPHQTAVAVATVVIFGTIAMFIYPLMYPYLEIAKSTMGIYTGATIHEVAQVVAAGNALGQDIGIIQLL